MAECKVLLHSDTRSDMVPVLEALRALLFPLTWPNVYIPFLPPQMRLDEILQVCGWQLEVGTAVNLGVGPSAIHRWL